MVFTEKPPIELGCVQRHGNGWRVKLRLSEWQGHGPHRSTNEEATSDLTSLRTAPTRVEMQYRLLQLNAVTSSGAVASCLHPTSSSSTDTPAHSTSKRVGQGEVDLRPEGWQEVGPRKENRAAAEDVNSMVCYPLPYPLQQLGHHGQPSDGFPAPLYGYPAYAPPLWRADSFGTSPYWPYGHGLAHVHPANQVPLYHDHAFTPQQ